MFRKTLLWLLYVTSLCLFVWFVFFKPTDFSIQNIYAENKPSINQETVKIDIPKTAETNLSNDDSVALVDTPQGEIKPQKDSLKTKKIIIERVADEQTEINTNQPYLVLVGSFGKLSNANRMLKRLEKLGLPGTLKKIGRLHRVIIASSSSKKSATEIKNRHNKTFDETPYVLEQ